MKERNPIPSKRPSVLQDVYSSAKAARKASYNGNSDLLVVLEDA